MKRLITISAYGESFYCTVCNGIFGPYTVGNEADPRFTVQQGLRHIVEKHATRWLIESGWVKEHGHIGRMVQTKNFDKDIASWVIYDPEFAAELKRERDNL